jgi:hypothetical protein
MHMSLRDDEFRVIRETIATRGTVRMALVPAAVFAWAVLVSGFLLFGNPHPIAVILSLLVLMAGFEAVHALHVGVERIGRYLQVFYEGEPGGPQWESTAMRVGPGLPGSGVDPLFTLVFVAATLTNLVVTLVFVAATLTNLVVTVIGQPTPAEAAVSLALHVAFIIRILRARLAAARQRTRDLEIFERLRAPATEHPHRPTL